jgi:hypothetical protein
MTNSSYPWERRFDGRFSVDTAPGATPSPPAVARPRRSGRLVAHQRGGLRALPPGRARRSGAQRRQPCRAARPAGDNHLTVAVQHARDRQRGSTGLGARVDRGLGADGNLARPGALPRGPGGGVRELRRSVHRSRAARVRPQARFPCSRRIPISAALHGQPGFARLLQAGQACQRDFLAEVGRR